ncbi:hypothetical protein [Neisseria arctica]|uniref:DUF6853 family protein n=1 Tax=Neisseria arctica TaxID=1470200 RepID=UPI001F395A8E|nr:hypothetical protein [Neisseria arctica]UOO87648.1 hypothetical protein LVJ86_05215 [Neisseria arctica]
MQISRAIDHEIGNIRWCKDYTLEGDWDNEFKEDLRNFLNYMRICQFALNDQNFKIASNALFMAMIYAGNLSQIFDAIKSDISTLLSAEYKVNDFQWPQLDE